MTIHDSVAQRLRGSWSEAGQRHMMDGEHQGMDELAQRATCGGEIVRMSITVWPLATTCGLVYLMEHTPMNCVLGPSLLISFALAGPLTLNTPQLAESGILEQRNLVLKINSVGKEVRGLLCSGDIPSADAAPGLCFSQSQSYRFELSSAAFPCIKPLRADVRVLHAMTLMSGSARLRRLASIAAVSLFETLPWGYCPDQTRSADRATVEIPQLSRAMLFYFSKFFCVCRTSLLLLLDFLLHWLNIDSR
ncbi:hypothetical protein C8R47DRAFT_1075517 [Mycena vitilis]|nr:hypothetical protein C8R47DRAFT_1075517 [Mycena vitilis]